MAPNKPLARKKRRINFYLLTFFVISLHPPQYSPTIEQVFSQYNLEALSDATLILNDC